MQPVLSRPVLRVSDLNVLCDGRYGGVEWAYVALLPDRPALLVSDLNVLCHYRYGDVV